MTNRTAVAVFVLLVAALGLTLAGCSSIERPKLTVEDVTFSGLTDQGVELEVGVRVTNPNDFAAEAAGLLYTLEINGIEVLDGRQDDPVSVPAGGSSEVTIPVTLRWGGSAEALKDVLKGGEQRWKLSGRVTVRSGIVHRTFPFSETGTFTTRGADERRESSTL